MRKGAQDTLPPTRRKVPGRRPPDANGGGVGCGGSRPSSRQCSRCGAWRAGRPSARAERSCAKKMFSAPLGGHNRPDYTRRVRRDYCAKLAF